MPRYFKDNPEGLKTLVDTTSTPGSIYIGKALAKTLEWEEWWQIKRVDINGGLIKIIYTLENWIYFDSIWTSRTSYTYQ